MGLNAVVDCMCLISQGWEFQALGAAQEKEWRTIFFVSRVLRSVEEYRVHKKIRQTGFVSRQTKKKRQRADNLYSIHVWIGSQSGVKHILSTGLALKGLNPLSSTVIRLQHENSLQHFTNWHHAACNVSQACTDQQRGDFMNCHHWMADTSDKEMAALLPCWS